MKQILILGWLAAATLTASAQIMLSGNENKLDLTSGAPVVVESAGPDSVSLLDFSEFPPRVIHVKAISNTVLGPPSNIAISPNGKLALIADSIRLEPGEPTGWVPHNRVHVLDLTQSPPKITGHTTAGRQPSGMSISPDGSFALVANRADGTVTMLSIDGQDVRARQNVVVCEPDESPSDVAIHPDGHLALVSVQKGGFLAVLHIGDGRVSATGRHLAVYGEPYRCVITPDGMLGLTAGAGHGNGLDADAVSIVDMKNLKTFDFVPVGSGPESLDISPDGSLAAVVTMDGSNLPADDPNHSNHGGLSLMSRSGHTFVRTEQLKTGRIPEGVAFTADGRYLVVQSHPERRLWIYRVAGNHLEDTGVRIAVPGMPSSLRSGP